MKRLPKIRFLNELRQLAAKEPRYANLAMIAANNLGQPSNDVATALRWLEINAMETDEDGVVDEINGVRDIELSKVKAGK